MRRWDCWRQEQGAENSALHLRLKLPNKILVSVLWCPLFSAVCVRLSVKRGKPNLGFTIVQRENMASSGQYSVGVRVYPIF